MDVAATFIFVGLLGFAALVLTMTVRRDFRAQERRRREQEPQSRHPPRKP